MVVPFFLYGIIVFMDGNKKPKVLLVEDDIFMIDLLSGEFANAGFEVAIAKNGVEAIGKYKESKPDLILLDLLLPDQNGFDTLRQIRREEEGAATKVIVLSNLSESADIEESKRLGVVDYLVKANTALPDIVARSKAALGM